MTKDGTRPRRAHERALSGTVTALVIAALAACGGTVREDREPEDERTEQVPPRITCGNDVVDDGEQCDGTAVPTCHTATMGAYPEGTVTCDADCTADTSACDYRRIGPEHGAGGGGTVSVPTAACGNGIVEEGEQCDGTAVPTCVDATMGARPTGVVTCSDTCTADVSGCWTFVG